jgi:peptidase M50-like protein
VTHPSTGWVLAAGLGVALVYFLSILAHELGHLIAARAVKIDVAAVQLNFAGGFVEMHDDDRLTAGRLAAIVGAGPLVTAFIVLAAWAALRKLGWPLTATPDLNTSAGVAIGRILSSAFVINLAALVLNLLPLRRRWRASAGRGAPAGPPSGLVSRAEMIGPALPHPRGASADKDLHELERRSYPCAYASSGHAASPGTPSPPSGFGPPIAIRSIPSGPASNARCTSGATRTTSHSLN